MKTTRLPKFIQDFIAGLSNESKGFSLKKLLSTGFFWLVCYLCIKHTDKDNFFMVLTALLATLTTLMGLNSYYTNKNTNIAPDNKPKTDQP